jgi:hypothetical protein
LAQVPSILDYACLLKPFVSEWLSIRCAWYGCCARCTALRARLSYGVGYDAQGLQIEPEALLVVILCLRCPSLCFVIAGAGKSIGSWHRGSSKAQGAQGSCVAGLWWVHVAVVSDRRCLRFFVYRDGSLRSPVYPGAVYGRLHSLCAKARSCHSGVVRLGGRSLWTRGHGRS